MDNDWKFLILLLLDQVNITDIIKAMNMPFPILSLFPDFYKLMQGR